MFSQIGKIRIYSLLFNRIRKVSYYINIPNLYEINNVYKLL